MTGKIHEFDARVGGGYRMSLFYPDSDRSNSGKTNAREDMFNARFVELTPPERIVEAVNFVSDDASYHGEATLTATFVPVPGGGEGGTEVSIQFDNLPRGIRIEDNDEGSRQSLEQLAAYFERG
jgi:uncharacterized protein YndB with AHSA1/START domain